MKTVTITVDTEACALLERLSYEIEARKTVISEMLAQNMDIETEAFRKYQGDLVKYKTQFETAKKEFQAAYVDTIPGAQRWNLEYANCTLTVEVQE